MHTHTHTHARTHARTDARTHARTHAHTLTEYAPGPGTAFRGVLNLGSLA